MSYNYEANKEETEQKYMDCMIDQSKGLPEIETIDAAEVTDNDYHDLMRVREISLEE